MNEALSQEEFDLQIEDMKNFMTLVLKIAFFQHLSNDQENTTANELYESFFPNPKKKTTVSSILFNALAPPENVETMNVNILDGANLADDMMSDRQIPSPQLRA